MTLLLAQFSRLVPPPVPPLPAPPLLERLFFEQPWPLGLLFTAAGIGVYLALRGSRARAARGAGAALVAAGVGIFLLAGAVHTDRELMWAAVSDLIEATAHARADLIAAQLAPDARLFSRYRVGGLSVGPSGIDREAILNEVRLRLGANPISEHAIQEFQAAVRGPDVGTTQVLVRTVFAAESMGVKMPVQSWWRVDWRKDPDGVWRVTAIELISLPGALSGS